MSTVKFYYNTKKNKQIKLPTLFDRLNYVIDYIDQCMHAYGFSISREKLKQQILKERKKHKVKVISKQKPKKKTKQQKPKKPKKKQQQKPKKKKKECLICCVKSLTTKPRCKKADHAVCSICYNRVGKVCLYCGKKPQKKELFEAFHGFVQRSREKNYYLLLKNFAKENPEYLQKIIEKYSTLLPNLQRLLELQSMGIFVLGSLFQEQYKLLSELFLGDYIVKYKI